MKVIQVVPELNAGGVERGTLELGRHLVTAGHKSVVISAGGALVDQLEAEGSRHIAFPVHRKSPRSFTGVPGLRRVLAEEAADIVHARSRVPAWMVWLAWRGMDPARRPRFVTTMHGFYSVNSYSAIMARGQAVMCVSNAVRDYAVKNYGLDPDRIAVVHRGVDPAEYPHGWMPPDVWRARWQAEFPALAGAYVVALPGRITRWKGQLDFVEVIARLRAAGIPAHGLIVGAPHPRRKRFAGDLDAEIAARGLGDAITLTGHRADLKEVMAASDAVVSCSTDPEAFGRVTLEAMALGRPVAAYDHGGVAEQLTAIFPEGRVAVGDTGAMADLLAAWHKAPPKVPDENPFTLAAMVEGEVAVYRRLLGD